MSRVFIIIGMWDEWLVYVIQDERVGNYSFKPYHSQTEAVVFSVSNKAQAAERYITNKRISYFCMMFIVMFFSTLIKVKTLLYFLENCDDLK